MTVRRTQAHLDRYGTDKASGQDSCCSPHSRIPYWFGLISGVLIMVLMILVADAMPLYLASAFGFGVAAYSFYRLVNYRPPSQAATGHAGPAPLALYTSRPPLAPPTVCQSTPPPMPMQFDDARGNVAAPPNLASALPVRAQQAPARSQQAPTASPNLTSALPVRSQQAPAPEQTLGLFLPSGGAEISNPDSVVAVLSMASAEDLADYLMEMALLLHREYTHGPWFLYQAASDIWVQNHLGQPDLPSSSQESVEQAHQIMGIATQMFVEAMKLDLLKIYGDVFDARGLQCERQAVAKSLSIWAQRYDWYLDKMRTQLEDWEMIEAYLDHINAYLAA